MGIKIAIIGAGSSQFSGGIIRDICVNPNLRDVKLSLMDIDEERLGFIFKMGKKLAEELDTKIEFEMTTDRKKALSGADFVINTAQDGGHPWHTQMQKMAAKHGYMYGGLLSLTYNAAFLLDVARDIERICPDAWLIQSANPVFEGCTAITRSTNVKTIGLCHGHYGYRDVAKVLGLDIKDVTAKMCGFNHWIFMTDFRYRGENAYPLLDKWIEEESEAYWKQPRKYSDQQMSRAAIHQYKLFGLMPIGDTPRMMDFPSMYGWIYNESLEAKKYFYSQQGGFDSDEGWGQYLEDLNENLKKIQEAALDPDKKVTDIFEARQSDEQIVPIIESLVYNIPGVYQVNIPNKGQLVEGFPEDIVVECEALISGAGVQGIHNKRLPSRVMAGAMNPRFTQCELICEALLSGERDAFKLAILCDHYTRSEKQADDLLDEWLSNPQNTAVNKLLNRKG